MSNNGPVGWPTATADPWPPSPQNTHPQKFGGLPAGVDRNASEAEQILATAVGWWDCSSSFRQGDRWLRNRGTGGEALDLRLGSSTAPNTNDPLFLEPEERGYVYCPANGNFLQGPKIAGTYQSVEIVIRANLDTPANDTGMFCTGDDYITAGTFSWFSLASNYGPQVAWTTAAGERTAMTIGVGGIPAGPRWWRIKVYTSGADTIGTIDSAPDSDAVPTSWTNYGVNTKVGKTGVYISGVTPGVYFGVARYGYWWCHAGAYKRGIVRLDDVTTIDIDCDAITDGSATQFTAVSGQTVSIVRPSAGRKAVAMPSRNNGGRPLMLFGSDDFMDGDRSSDAQRRLVSFPRSSSMTVIGVTRQWNTPANSSVIGAKWSGNNTGWLLNTGLTMQSGSTSAVISPYPLALTFGQQTVLAARCVEGGKMMTAFINGTAGTSAGYEPVDCVVPAPVYLAVGHYPDGLVYLDMEFTGAAVFRRALSQREIQLISDYYTKPRYFAAPTKDEQKAVLATKLNLDLTNDAAVLDVLADAVFYVDAKTAVSGERYAKNLGWRGDALNMRYGSSNVANSNDPKLLQPEASGYVYLPGVDADYLQTWRSVIPDPGDVTYMMYASDINDGLGLGLQNHNLDRFVYFKSGGVYYYRALFDGMVSPSYFNFIASATSLPTLWGRDRGWIAWTRFTNTSNSTTEFRAFYAKGEPNVVPSASDWVLIGMAPWGGILPNSTHGSYSRVSLISGVAGATNAKVYHASISGGVGAGGVPGGTPILDIDCNVIVNGNQTSFLATTGQTIDMVRATSGRKTVAMPSIANGGKNCWLLGTDDYFECDSPLQHDWLNFGAGESYAVYLVARQPSYTASQQMVNKEDNGANGWRLQNHSVTVTNFSAIHWSGTTSAGATAVGRVPGTLYAYTQVVDRVTGLISAQMNDVVATGALGSIGGTMTTASPLRIGKSAQGSVYADMEAQAALIFRRALSAGEIATLNTYFGGN